MSFLNRLVRLQKYDPKTYDELVIAAIISGFGIGTILGLLIGNVI